jgi:hypothetical protein
MVSGADWFSFLTTEDAWCLSLMMSLLKIFSKGWNVYAL